MCVQAKAESEGGDKKDVEAVDESGFDPTQVRLQRTYEYSTY